MDGSQAAQPETSNADKLDRSVIITGLVVISGMIMVLLDTTIVNVALDTLSQELSAPLSTGQWTITGYLLAAGLVIPMTGWAVDRFGAKPIWISALVLFTVGSGLCALAWNMESLIAFRVLQGLGGGMLLPCGQTIIARAAGPKRLGQAMALLGVPMLLGPVLGPMLGGLLVEYAAWEWIFLVNLPVGVLAIWLAANKLADGTGEHDPGPLDWFGALLLSAGLVGLLYGLSEASSRGTFSEAGVYVWLIAAAVLVAAFVVYALRRTAPSIINVRMFRNKVFAAGSVSVLLIAIALFGGMLLMPLYYQTVRAEGAFMAGLLLVPQGLGAMAIMPIAGRLTDRIGAGSIVPFGVILALLGTAPFGMISEDTSYVWLSFALFIRGLGIGAVMMPTIASAYSDLSHRDVSSAAPTISAIQQVGGALGSALMVTVLTQRMRAEFEATGIDGEAAGSDQLTDIPPDVLEVVAPPMSTAFGQTFWVAFALTAVVLVAAAFLPRRPAAVPAGPESPPEPASAEELAPGEGGR